MDVAILGASGDCGREIAAQLVASRLLDRTERLQLVGRADGPSARILHGLAADLSDAFAEHVPELDVALSPEEVVADIWVVAAGITLPTGGRFIDRQALATTNGALFARYADALAKHGQGSEVVVVVSNPVELGVAIFAQAVGRHRVIGIGAYQDTMRFRREIAADLGIRRQRVGGFLLGEHGDGLVPVWSSVTLHGYPDDEAAAAIASVRRGADSGDYGPRSAAAKARIVALLEQERLIEAYAEVDALPPDLRVTAKPFITHYTGAKTVRATAGVTVDLVETLLDGREVLVAGQVLVEKGEFADVHGPLGVPVLVGPDGIRRVVELPLTDDERARFSAVTETVNGRINGWMEAIR